MNTISLTLTKKQIDKLYETFKENSVTPPPYAIYRLNVENCTIVAYTSNKVVFQGKDAEVYASPFMSQINEISDTYNCDNTNTYPQAGSDEVGTGDYFGPVCVCACKIEKEDLVYLKTLNIQDSKALDDNQIREIAPKLMNRLKYSLLIVENSKYNIIHKTNNLNAIKAKLHNQAYLNLSTKSPLPSLLVVDQFTPPKSYFRYLEKEKRIINNLFFTTKAESKYLSVACASMIARYAFLVKWDEMEKKYNFTFHKGASSLVDQDIKQFVAKYGTKELENVAKLHFKNTLIIK